MRRRALLSAVAAFLLIAGAMAAEKPNFTGTWVMDKSRSFGIPPDMEQTLVVVHSGDKITVEIKIVTSAGERVINDVYTLDGKESEFIAQTPRGPGGKGKRRASWLPDGNRIVINEDSTVETPNGPLALQQMRKWSMSADGGTLTIDYYTDSARGSGESKRVYVKK